MRRGLPPSPPENGDCQTLQKSITGPSLLENNNHDGIAEYIFTSLQSIVRYVAGATPKHALHRFVFLSGRTRDTPEPAAVRVERGR
jgi:hypothetical protein